MSDEKQRGCVVVAKGHIAWDAFAADDDQRWNEPIGVLLVLDDDGFHQFVTPDMCYRDGTSIGRCELGDAGRLTYRGASAVGFSCPKLRS